MKNSFNKLAQFKLFKPRLIIGLIGFLFLGGITLLATNQIKQRQVLEMEAACDPECKPCDKGFNFRSFYDTQDPDRAYYDFCPQGKNYCNGKNPGCFTEESGCLRGDNCNDRAPQGCCSPSTPDPTPTPKPRICQKTICIPTPTPTATPTLTPVPTSTPTPTATPTPTPTPTPIPLPCCADIVFLIDRSNSVLQHINQQNALINNMLSKITSTTTGDRSLDVRVTIVSFGNNVRDDKPDWDYDFESALSAVDKKEGLGGTCIECALDKAEQLLQDLDKAPPREATETCKEGEEHKVLILLTDGQPTIGRGGAGAQEFCAPGFVGGTTIDEINKRIQECITKLEKKLRQPDETLSRIQQMVDKTIIIGIGDDIATNPDLRPGYGVNHGYLEEIASPEGYFAAESFSEMLRDEQKKDQLAQEICYFGLDEPVITPPPPSHAQCSAAIAQIGDDTVQITCQLDAGSSINRLMQASFYIKKDGGSEQFIKSQTCQPNNLADCLKTTYAFTDNQCFEAICKLRYN